jgi:uncharacterized protein YecE (DUF72 family)
LNDYLVGTGGWAYFDVPDKSPLKAYSEIFNFVEVNSTFYEYPETRKVQQWRKTVPKDFTFSVRCHQDLTHRIGLKPVDEAFAVFDQMMVYCHALEAPFLVLETPASYVINQPALEDARQFFSIVNHNNVRLVWEIRALITSAALGLMRDFSIVHCVDLSKQTPCVKSDVVYSHLFGKGQSNIYQFTDDELVDIDKKAQSSGAKIVAMSYHGLRMFSDAARFLEYQKTGKFLPVTSSTGVDSVKAVLSEDAKFPSSKAALIEDQGWKVVDVSADKRIRLSELLANIPLKTYQSVSDVVKVLEATK